MYGIIKIMKQNDRTCHRITIRSTKQLEGYLQRDRDHIEGTPKLILGRGLPNGGQEIWIEQFSNDSLSQLKQLCSNEKAYAQARRLIIACSKLAPRYGYFILNENMVFCNTRNQVLVWINPDALENRVKIYLPNNGQGEAAMVRSIVTYLKLWLRLDYQYLTVASNLDELLVKFESVRTKALDRLRIKALETDIRPSFNFEEISQTLKNIRVRASQDQLKQNRSAFKPILKKSVQKLKGKEAAKLFLSFPNRQKWKGQIKQQKKLRFKTSFGAQTDTFSGKSESFEGEFQHKTFNNYHSSSSTNYSVTQSAGLSAAGSSIASCTLSGKVKHPIVQLITSQDNTPDQYSQNRIVGGKQQECLKRLKQSLEGIGEQINELFLSNIQSQNSNAREEELKGLTAEFETLLS